MTDRVTPSSRDTIGSAELESLVGQHYERLLRVAVLICRERADGEDAVQLALERAWRHGADLRDPDRLSAWLRRIVVREAIRIEGRKRGLLARWFAGPREIAVVAPRSTDQDLELREALDGLPPGHRAAIVLHHLEGYSVAETADLLGVPLETARSRLRTARDRLREALTPSE
jgi:RNA polymerase sigma-70 factor (ECF subfamily)